MSSRYLLDTNTASYIIKGNVPRVRERLLKVPMSQVLISAVTEAELLFGAARKREAVRLKTAIDEFLLRVDSLPWDSNAARRYAGVRALSVCQLRVFRFAIYSSIGYSGHIF
jgi:tRNA(fMet)-specific endonuclease VapC